MQRLLPGGGAIFDISGWLHPASCTWKKRVINPNASVYEIPCRRDSPPPTPAILSYILLLLRPVDTKFVAKAWYMYVPGKSLVAKVVGRFVARRASLLQAYVCRGMATQACAILGLGSLAKLGGEVPLRVGSPQRLRSNPFQQLRLLYQRGQLWV